MVDQSNEDCFVLHVELTAYPKFSPEEIFCAFLFCLWTPIMRFSVIKICPLSLDPFAECPQEAFDESISCHQRIKVQFSLFRKIESQVSDVKYRVNCLKVGARILFFIFCVTAY